MPNRFAWMMLIAAIGLATRADDGDHLRADPWIFVGHAGDCGTPYPPGSNIVTSAWLRGMGLPDQSDQQMNTTLLDTLIISEGAASRRDAHTGLVLNKDGPTADCSSAGATIRGVEGLRVGPSPDAAFVLGFDYRDGTHCGAGSPRFNLVARQGPNARTFHFIGGCANGVPTPAPQDPAEWTRVRFANTAATAFPPIPPGSVIESIDLVVDEGTDAASVEDPRGVGLSVVDNIFVNGQFIRRGQGIAEPGEGKHDD
jgi:hypothetical protein